MASILTYNQIITIFDSFRVRHPQLNGLYIGRGEDFTGGKDFTYPCMQVYIESAVMPKSERGDYPVIELSLKCKILDKQQADGITDNTSQRMLADTLQIAQDCVNEFNQHPYYTRSQAQLTNDINFIAIEDNTADLLIGHEFNLDFRLINNNSFCGLPLEDIAGYSAPGTTTTGYSYSIQYLTCSSLRDCSTFIDLVNSSVTSNSISGNSISAGTYYSGSTNLYNIFQQIGTSSGTLVQPGSNITTGGTASVPIVSVVNSPSFNNVSLSGTLSSDNITAPSGTLNVNGNVSILGSVSVLGTATTFDVQRVQTKDNRLELNWSTGGTTSHITAVGGGLEILSGKTDGTSSLLITDSVGNWSASTGFYSATLSGGTIYSGGTDLYNIFSTTDTNTVTNVQPGTNISTGGTSTTPVVNLVASPSINNLSSSGTGTFNSLSATTLSGGTIYSGSTNLETIINNISSTISGSTFLRPTQVAFGSATSGITSASILTVGAVAGKVSISGSGIPFIVASTSGNDLKIEFRDVATPRGYFGATTNTPFVIANSAGNTVMNYNSTGLFIGGSNAATSRVDILSSTTATGAIRIRSGSTVAAPNDGELWYNGTNLSGSFAGKNSTLMLDSGVRLTAGILPLVTADNRLADSAFLQNGSSGVTLYGGLSITGNLNILGSASTTFTTSLAVGANKIYLNSGGSNNHLTAIDGGIIVLSGTANNTPATLTVNSVGNWSANTTVIASGFTVTTGGKILSGNTDLYNIFAKISGSSGVDLISVLGNLTDIGSATLPVLSINDNPAFNGLTLSGTGTAVAFSATTLSGATILSGSSNLYSIFTPLGTVGTTYVQPGTNISTGGTAVNPVVNLIASPSINNISVSGTGTAVAFSATTLSGRTLYSGSTDLSLIFVTHDNNDITRVQPGLNIYTGGTANSPTLNISAGTLTSLSAGTLSGGTILSGSTNLYNIFVTTDTNTVTNVQPGSNISTGGTATSPIVNLVASPSINNLTLSGTGTAAGFSATTLSGGTIYSGNTNIFSTITGATFLPTTQIAVGNALSGISSSASLAWANTELKVVGGVRLNSTIQSGATYTAQTSDYFISSSINIDLPLCGSDILGKIYVIKNTDSGVGTVVKVSPFPGNTIENVPFKNLSSLGAVSGSLNAITIICDGSEWWVTSAYYIP